MVFENLLKPPHLKRFLLALAAAAAAVVIYLSAEHFRVIPGTAALDEDGPASSAPGAQSVAVIPQRGQCPDNIPSVLSLEAIRYLQRVPAIEVIAARSALGLAESLQLGEKLRVSADTAWVVEIRCDSGGGELQISATVVQTGESGSSRELTQQYSGDTLPRFFRDITAQLTERLGVTANPPVMHPRPIESSAYQNFLQARLLLLTGGLGVQRAQELLKQGLETEPDWSSALAAYAYSLILQTGTHPQELEFLLQEANSSLERSLQKQPDHPESLLYRSIIAHRFEWQWEEAYDSARKALEYAPGNADILAAASTAAFTLGRFDEGMDYINEAILLDPLVPGHRLKYGLMLEFDGQHQAAIDAYRELMEQIPEYPGVHAYLGRTLVVAGRAEAALPHVEIERTPFWRDYGTVLVHYALERNEEADEKFARLIEQHAHEAAMQIAEIHAFTDRTDQAFEWLQLAVEQRDPGVSELIGNPLLESLVEDPRWESLLSSLGLRQQNQAD